jgi:drug/metabolite transporter (DMT)-like permease
LLAVSRARRNFTPATVMLYPGIVSAALLLVAALVLGDGLLPQTWHGVAALIALAAISHVGGQGLAVFALGHLPAVFSSLMLFCETVAAVLLAYLLFGEPVVALQLLGGALILAGLFAARPRRASRESQ